MLTLLVIVIGRIKLFMMPNQTYESVCYDRNNFAGLSEATESAFEGAAAVFVL